MQFNFQEFTYDFLSYVYSSAWNIIVLIFYESFTRIC